MGKAKGREVAASDVPSEMEEANDSAVKSVPHEPVSMEEDTTMVVDKSEEGKKEEAKENEEINSVGIDVPEGEKADEEDSEKKVKATEEVNADRKDKSVSSKKAKILRKRKKKAVVNAVAASREKTKEAPVVESVPPESVDKGEKVTIVVDKTEEVKPDGNGENPSNKKAKILSKRKKKAVVSAAASSGKKEASAAVGVSNEKPEVKPKDTDQPGSSTANKKNLKLADSMGLIFMCNSKTKKDCFHYKVLGLPASKKGMVEKIYKGMRLFLFDIDLKLMYGIFKATSPGGYNLEPKAFKSAFPSQVRFKVLNDCSPLPEEKFKAAIKDNYYGRNKFNNQLSAEQVKNLCNIFQNAGKTTPSSRKRSRDAIREEPELTFSDRGRKQRPQRERSREDRERRPRRERSREDRRRRPQRERSREGHIHQRISDRDVYSRREAYASPPRRPVAYASPPRYPVAYASPPRRPVVYASPPRRPVVYASPPRRPLDYGSPPSRLVALPPPLPSSYGYDRMVDDLYYRRELVPSAVEPRDHRIMGTVDSAARDAVLYREPLPRREALYTPSFSSMMHAPPPANVSSMPYPPPPVTSVSYPSLYPHY